VSKRNEAQDKKKPRGKSQHLARGVRPGPELDLDRHRPPARMNSERSAVAWWGGDTIRSPSGEVNATLCPTRARDGDAMPITVALARRRPPGSPLSLAADLQRAGTMTCVRMARAG
jgi:hypothetical protein